MTKGLVHVRIDDRLIHGQVAVYWCNAVNATRIMVANDVMYENDVLMTLHTIVCLLAL